MRVLEEISEGEEVDPNQTIWSQRHTWSGCKSIEWIDETVTSEIKVTTAGNNKN
ncbi:MAG: hypothetical protein ACOX1Y_02885 [Zhaonellaceae bacterium]